jgi:carboxylesterase type B
MSRLSTILLLGFAFGCAKQEDHSLFISALTVYKHNMEQKVPVEFRNAVKTNDAVLAAQFAVCYSNIAEQLSSLPDAYPDAAELDRTAVAMLLRNAKEQSELWTTVHSKNLVDMRGTTEANRLGELVEEFWRIGDMYPPEFYENLEKARTQQRPERDK